MSIRDIKRQARRDLHAIMRVPAFYIPTPGAAGILIHVRPQVKFEALGIVHAENGLATRREAQPKIIFFRDELAEKGITISRRAVVSVELGEAYLLDNDDAPDDISVTWFVSALRPAETVGLPVPGDGDE